MICKNCENNKFLMITKIIDKKNFTERFYECSHCGNKFKTIEIEQDILPSQFIQTIEILKREPNDFLKLLRP